MQEIEPPSILLHNGAVYAGFGTLESVLLIILCILLLASALISGSEAAFFSLSPTDKEDLKANDSKNADFVTRLLKKPKDLLATILITNNFVNVGIVILSSAFITKVYAPSPENLGTHFLLEVIIITLVLLLLGEVIPKIYATKNAIRDRKSVV